MESIYSHKISHQHEFSLLTVQVPANQKLMVEAGAMATMSSTMSMKAMFKGGFRRFFTGESFMVSSQKKTYIFTKQGCGIIMIKCLLLFPKCLINHF